MSDLVSSPWNGKRHFAIDHVEERDCRAKNEDGTIRFKLTESEAQMRIEDLAVKAAMGTLESQRKTAA